VTSQLSAARRRPTPDEAGIELIIRRGALLRREGFTRHGRSDTAARRTGSELAAMTRPRHRPGRVRDADFIGLGVAGGQLSLKGKKGHG
jgi:hypothetical protein